MICGNHFYRMYKLPDHFFIPLGQMVILLIQNSRYLMDMCLRSFIISELGDIFSRCSFRDAISLAI